jgi:hypothetical protein
MALRARMMRILHSVPVAAVSFLCALAAVLAHSQAPGPQPPPPPPPLVLSGGTVIDVTGWGNSANDISNAVVIIEGNRITAVGPSSSVQIPKNAQVIDCSGKYLIPGLVDGFAGMNSQGQANANLYMGVTTVVVRQDLRHGLIDFAANPKPHLYPIDSVGSTDNWSLLAGQPGWNSLLKEGTNPAELNPETTARQLAATQKLGTRVVFLGHDITAANAQWIIARAHQLSMVAYGEFVATPYTVGIEAGVDALLHMGRYELGVIPNELQEPLVTDPEGPASRTAYDYSERLPPTDPHWRTYAQFIASHRAALLPTFSVYYAQLPGHSNLWKEPAASLLDAANMYHPTDPASGELNYPMPSWARRLPAFLQRSMQNELRKRADQDAMRLWTINQAIFAAFPHYLAGSGASSMGTMSGISEHTELELMVRLGLSPREVLAAATNNYSLQFGWHDLGQIAPGRRADILVLDADPTTNIWNARRIATLIFDGSVIDREGLLHMKK